MIRLRRLILTCLQAKARTKAASAFRDAEACLTRARQAHAATPPLTRAKRDARTALLRMDMEIAR